MRRRNYYFFVDEFSAFILYVWWKLKTPGTFTFDEPIIALLFWGVFCGWILGFYSVRLVKTPQTPGTLTFDANQLKPYFASII